MAWEHRNNGKRYYYRARRVDGRVVKEYVGTGPIAEAAARQDAQQRAERQTQLQAERARRERYEAAQQLLSTLCDECDALVAAALTAAGYYQHHRQWRKRRGKSARNSAARRSAS